MVSLAFPPVGLLIIVLHLDKIIFINRKVYPSQFTIVYA